VSGDALGPCVLMRLPTVSKRGAARTARRRNEGRATDGRDAGLPSIRRMGYQPGQWVARVASPCDASG
jgi:hypothetical protein